MDSLTATLREAGYKITGPRRAVIQVLEIEGHHLSPAEVLERGRAIHPGLSRATVYRTLDLLTELGALRPIYLGDGGSRVARVAKGHHHLICLSCGTAIHFEECVAAELTQILSERFGFRVKSHLLELYGTCEDCQR